MPGFFKHPTAASNGLVYATVLTVDSATIDTGANAFPATGNILTVYALLRTDEAATSSSVGLRFNNDSGNDYDGNRVQAINAAASAAALTAAANVQFVAAAASDSSGVATSMQLIVPGYAGTTLNGSGLLTTAIPDQTAANQVIQVRGVNWRSTAAINQVSLAIITGSGQKFKAGSALYVYIQ